METKRDLGGEFNKGFELLDSEKVLLDEINRFKERVDRHLNRCEDEISIKERELEEERRQLQERKKEIEEKRLRMLNLMESFGSKKTIEEPIKEKPDYNYDMVGRGRPYGFEDNLRKTQGDN